MRRLRNSSLLMVLVLFCISIVLFGGCGKKEQEKISEEYSGETYPENGLPKDKEVTLSMIFPVQGYGKDYFDYAVKTFQEKFKNVKINVRYIEEGGNTYRQIINAAIQSGNDKEMYDWIYSLSPETLYIQEGKVEQQDDLWERTLYDNPEVKVKDALLISKESAFAYNGTCG